MPARIKPRNVVGLSEAGPIVATILVLLVTDSTYNPDLPIRADGEFGSSVSVQSRLGLAGSGFEPDGSVSL